MRRKLSATLQKAGGFPPERYQDIILDGIFTKIKLTLAMYIIANFDLTAILDYRFNENWRASLLNNYVGSNDYELNNGQKGDVDAYNLTDIHLAYQTGGFEVSTEIKNLFDEDYVLPEPARRNIAEIPGGPERSFYLTMRYAF